MEGQVNRMNKPETRARSSDTKAAQTAAARMHGVYTMTDITTASLARNAYASGTR